MIMWRLGTCEAPMHLRTGVVFAMHIVLMCWVVHTKLMMYC